MFDGIHGKAVVNKRDTTREKQVKDTVAVKCKQLQSQGAVGFHDQGLLAIASSPLPRICQSKSDYVI